MRTLAALALAVAMLASTPAAAFAQTEPRLAVMVDGTGPFSQGDTITVSGTVRDLLDPFPGITLQIRLSPDPDPDSNEAAVFPAPTGQVLPAFLKAAQISNDDFTDKSFSVDIRVGGPTWTRSGDYIVAATYGPYDAYATFNYISGGTPEPAAPETFMLILMTP